MKPLDAGQVVGFLLLDLALIVLVARLVGTLFVRLGQPRVVGEIVAGVLLGPTLLGPALWEGFSAPDWLHCAQSLVAAPAGTVESPTWCVFPAQARSIIGGIGQVALLLFMFLTGLEVDGDVLKGRLKGIVLVGAGVVVVPMALGLVIGPVMATEIFKPAEASDLGFILYIGALMAVTAFPVMVRILQEKGLTLSTMGATGIAAAAVCTVVMFMTASAAAALSRGEGVSVLGTKLALSIAYLAAMVFVIRPLMARAARPYQASGKLDSGSFALIIIMTLGSGYVAHLLGLTVIVGGFMAGLVLPARKPLFADMTSRLGEFTATILLPVFLAFSGLGTDFTMLSTAALGGLGLFLLGGIVGKWLGGAALARLGGLSWAEGNVLGVLMNCRGLLVLVVALEGVQANVISGVTQVGAVMMALITTAMTGPLFDRFIRSVPADEPQRGAGTAALAAAGEA
ncbi:MAG TPA: cation:proton antiporter [Gemmatimonadota bacterium]|jgi:Kef-type K+ transport system membrane component KefB